MAVAEKTSHYINIGNNTSYALWKGGSPPSFTGKDSSSWSTSNPGYIDNAAVECPVKIRVGSDNLQLPMVNRNPSVGPRLRKGNATYGFGGTTWYISFVVRVVDTVRTGGSNIPNGRQVSVNIMNHEANGSHAWLNLKYKVTIGGTSANTSAVSLSASANYKNSTSLASIVNYGLNYSEKINIRVRVMNATDTSEYHDFDLSYTCRNDTTSTAAFWRCVY